MPRPEGRRAGDAGALEGRRDDRREGRRRPRWLRALCSVYRLGLAMLPADVRGRWAPPMLQTFLAVCQRVRRRRGRLAAATVAAAELLDLARMAWRLRRRRWRRPRVRRPSGSRPPAPRAGGWGHDVRQALRSLRRSPGFTVVAVATVAVGVGTNAAIFSVVDGLLLRPLPFPEAARLFEVWNRVESGGGFPGLAAPVVAALREEAAVFDRVEAFGDGRFQVITGTDAPRQITVSPVTPGLLDLLDARPALGRRFTAAEARPGAAPVLLISDGLWRRRFGSDPGVLGSTIHLDGEPHAVVGVMPADFRFPSRGTSAWMPWTPGEGGGRSMVVARRAAEISEAALAERLEGVAGGLVEAGVLEEGWGLRPWRLDEGFLFHTPERVERSLWVLLGAVALVLLIGCANLAHLTLARSAARRSELAVRAALGAGRWRLVRQLLAESLLVGLGGGLAGVVAARWTVDLMLASAPDRLGFLRDRAIGVDHRVLLFALAAVALAGLLTGLAPALRATGGAAAVALAGARAGTAGGRERRLGAALVVAQVALSLVLLAGAGLLVRSFTGLLAVNPGFEVRGVHVAALTKSQSAYADPASRRVLIDALEDLLAGLPGVQAAAVAQGAPPSLGLLTSLNRVEAEGRPAGADGPVTARDASEVEFLAITSATPGYFAALGLPLRAGRSLAPGDEETGAVVVSESMARRLWSAGGATGQRFRLGPDEPWLTVVGVVPDIRQTGLDDRRTRAAIYRPLRRDPGSLTHLQLVYRTAGAGTAAAAVLRERLRALDPDLPLQSVTPLWDLLVDDLAEARFQLVLMAIFAGIAVITAALGIHGVMAHAVAGRMREIGIRMALGADARGVFFRVVARGAGLACLGVVVGLAGAWGATRLLSSLLYEVTPTDPLTFAAVILFLLAVAITASALPARRAVRVDPRVALESE